MHNAHAVMFGLEAQLMLDNNYPRVKARLNDLEAAIVAQFPNAEDGVVQVFQLEHPGFFVNLGPIGHHKSGMREEPDAKWVQVTAYIQREVITVTKIELSVFENGIPPQAHCKGNQFCASGT